MTTSPATDIQPELPETQLGHVIGACSEDDGVPDIGVSIGLGEGSMLWLGELLKRDGADIGFVFHGPDGKRIVAPIWPNCEWQDVADLLRHHVAPILARLTFTTPTLGDMAMQWLSSIERDAADVRAGSEQHSNGMVDACARLRSMLAAAPASPIPISVNGTGERERIGAAIDSFSAGMLHSEKIDAVIAALSPALDNTAALPDGWRYWLLDGARILRSNGSEDHAAKIEALEAALTAETENAR